MVNYRLSYTKIFPLLFSVFCLGSSILSAQGNCLVYPEGSKQRLACEYGYKALEYKQGSREQQLLFDSALALNPNYAWAYYEKSVAYFKRGLLSDGIILLNKAVELDPSAYLTYRAYWYFNHKSYLRCLDDLETFYGRDDSYLSYTPGGGVNMQIVMGVVYAELGRTEKAVQAIEDGISEYPSPDFMGLYDYHLLGVAHLLNGDPGESIKQLKKSLEVNPFFADTYYYLGEAEEKLGNLEKARVYFRDALKRYRGEIDGGYSGNPFCFPVPEHIAEEKMKSIES